MPEERSEHAVGKGSLKKGPSRASVSGEASMGCANGGSKSKTAGAVVRMARNPNTVVVLHPHSSSVVSLDLCLRNADEPCGLLTKSMAREEGECAEKTLDRIRMLCAPKRSAGALQKRSREEILAGCPPIFVLGTTPTDTAETNGVDEQSSAVEEAEEAQALGPLDASLPNRVFWKYAKVLKLGAEDLRVSYNVPTITAIAPPGTPYVGLPLVCSNITTVFAQGKKLSYEWCVRSKGDAALQVISTSPVLIPSEALLGESLILRVTPSREIGLWTQVELAAVQRGPPPMARWGETAERAAAPALRVVTYNILFDDFCTSKHAKTHIYPFATDEVLDIENRKVRILQELLAYRADLLCLQECGRRLFERFLAPGMEACGYGGHYANKSGNVQEGCGFFFRKERFELLQTETIPLNWETLSCEHGELALRISTHAPLKQALENVTSIGAVLLLREMSTQKEMVLSNTHLFYHANACHIRILQAYMLLHFLYRTATMSGAGAARVMLSGEESKIRPIVLCGDCNFTHTTGGYRLVTTGQIESPHHSWEKGKIFCWGCDRQLGFDKGKLSGVGAATDASSNTTIRMGSSTDLNEAPTPCYEEGGDGVVDENRLPFDVFFNETLRSPIVLSDAYGRTDPKMPWTNYAMSFKEVIDYIFFSADSIDVLRTVPIPPESELAGNYALPNASYPSDHIALIADLVLKN